MKRLVLWSRHAKRARKNIYFNRCWNSPFSKFTRFNFFITVLVVSLLFEQELPKTIFMFFVRSNWDGPKMPKKLSILTDLDSQNQSYPNVPPWFFCIKGSVSTVLNKRRTFQKMFSFVHSVGMRLVQRLQAVLIILGFIHIQIDSSKIIGINSPINPSKSQLAAFVLVAHS